MNKLLNVDILKSAMENLGISQAAIAKELSVSRESVRKWVSRESFPRPDKLIRLGRYLNLSFSDLVLKEEDSEPVIAFRKTKRTITKEHHVENAKSIGRMLRHLVPYLPFDVLAMPPVLKNPQLDYEYLQHAANLVREEIRVDLRETIDFHHLIRHFAKLQTVVIPVLWGCKHVHENATHIYLPDSKTTWVYLNLDVNAHDFKFWMAHELGHCLAPDLRGNEAEDFADLFAGALLFPDELARVAYRELANLVGVKAKLNAITLIAEEHTISPLTVYKQINSYALSSNLEALDLEPGIYKWMTNLNKRYLNVSESLFSDEWPPEPKLYVSTIGEAFETPIFEILARYLKEEHKGPSYVQAVMDIPLLDARGIFDELN